MNNMKRMVSLLLALAMCTALVSCGGKTEPQPGNSAGNTSSGNTSAGNTSEPAGTPAEDYVYSGPRMTVGGADSTGTAYAAAAAVATVFSNNINGFSCDATTSSGSNENALNVHEGNYEMGTCSGDSALDAWNGTGPFEGQGGFTNLRAIGAVYPSVSNWIALKSSGYTYLHDAAGSNGVFGIGPAASTTESSAILGLKVAGITAENATLQNVTLGDAADNTANGTMTAGSAFAGAPVGAQLNASYTKECVWLGFTDEELDQICAENPAYYKASIPAGTYNGQDEDVPTFGVKLMIICNDEMDYDLAYQMAKTFCEQADTMIEGNAFFYEMADRTFICNDLPIPLHPGAEAYYKDAGLLK